MTIKDILAGAAPPAEPAMRIAWYAWEVAIGSLIVLALGVAIIVIGAFCLPIEGGYALLRRSRR